MRDYLLRQIGWSIRTFGEAKRTLGITRHIEKEIAEVRKNPDDLTEWIDIVILAIDGYWRHGGSPDNLMKDLVEKQQKNFARVWPSPPPPEDEASEHIEEEKTLTYEQMKAKRRNKQVCVWKYDDDYDYYSTSCGEEWTFTYGEIKPNSHVKYCMSCGKLIKLEERKKQSEED